MEEALEILWTYARRQAIDCNGKVVIPTINQSIAAIRLIIRLEGARKNNEKKMNLLEKRQRLLKCKNCNNCYINEKNEKSIYF